MSIISHSYYSSTVVLYSITLIYKVLASTIYQGVGTCNGINSIIVKHLVEHFSLESFCYVYHHTFLGMTITTAIM